MLRTFTHRFRKKQSPIIAQLVQLCTKILDQLVDLHSMVKPFSLERDAVLKALQKMANVITLEVSLRLHQHFSVQFEQILADEHSNKETKV
jgi:hypothetical protein